MTRYWVGVASRDHVRAGQVGGFCQLCHGNSAPVKRLKAGDRIIYYSPRDKMREGDPVQAFTAIGEVCSDEIRQVCVTEGFRPFRRELRFFPARDAAIRPLLPILSFTRGQKNWGYAFRRGAFEISSEDYKAIANAMGSIPGPTICQLSGGARPG